MCNNKKTWKTAQDEREAKVKEAEKRVRDLEDERQRLDKGIEFNKDNNNNTNNNINNID